MVHMEPSFVLYALLPDPGCRLRAHTVLIGTVEPVEPGKKRFAFPSSLRRSSGPTPDSAFADLLHQRPRARCCPHRCIDLSLASSSLCDRVSIGTTVGYPARSTAAFGRCGADWYESQMDVCTHLHEESARWAGSVLRVSIGASCVPRPIGAACALHLYAVLASYLGFLLEDPNQRAALGSFLLVAFGYMALLQFLLSARYNVAALAVTREMLAQGQQLSCGEFFPWLHMVSLFAAVFSSFQSDGGIWGTHPCSCLVVWRVQGLPGGHGPPHHPGQGTHPWPFGPQD